MIIPGLSQQKKELNYYPLSALPYFSSNCHILSIGILQNQYLSHKLITKQQSKFFQGHYNYYHLSVYQSSHNDNSTTLLTFPDLFIKLNPSKRSPTTV